ncbi:hypothetical protein DSO57_1012529 [Entomophthora muscae]|uniref:Uncharacterized protein n=1 Tax=Entomophthora muscae TaxID=34485 RepID=A0ACC2SUQ3_9FUNG|nr:hypothetical protein DSO57_1012529 [Entomophthora muscae]
MRIKQFVYVSFLAVAMAQVSDEYDEDPDDAPIIPRTNQTNTKEAPPIFIGKRGGHTDPKIMVIDD